MTRLTNLRLHGLGVELDEEDLLDEVTEVLVGGCPGVEGIKAKIHSARLDGDDVLVDVTLDPKDYFRQCHALEEDDLQTLIDLKAAGLSGDELTSLIEWLKSDPDLKITVFSTKDGELEVDEYPSKPSL